MIRRLWFTFGTVVLLAASVGQVHAHAFNVGFMAPLSGPGARQGQRALDGFLFATRERDGHAFEESDGHLGGLDSYVIRIDSARGRDAVRGQLDNLFQGEEIVFLTGVSLTETLSAIGFMPDKTQTMLVDAEDSVVYRSAARVPESLLTREEVPFSVGFREANGYAPDAHAIGGYIAARFIDAAVSAVQGEFSQREAMARALEQARAQLP